MDVKGTKRGPSRAGGVIYDLEPCELLDFVERVRGVLRTWCQGISLHPHITVLPPKKKTIHTDPANLRTETRKRTVFQV